MNESQTPPALESATDEQIIDYAQKRIEMPAKVLRYVILASLAMMVLAYVQFIVSVNQGQVELERSKIPMTLVVTALSITVTLLTLEATWMMARLRNYHYVRAMVILVALPFISPCCILCLPFGIWSMIALHDPYVRKAFELTAATTRGT